MCIPQYVGDSVREPENARELLCRSGLHGLVNPEAVERRDVEDPTETITRGPRCHRVGQETGRVFAEEERISNGARRIGMVKHDDLWMKEEFEACATSSSKEVSVRVVEQEPFIESSQFGGYVALHGHVRHRELVHFDRLVEGARRRMISANGVAAGLEQMADPYQLIVSHD